LVSSIPKGDGFVKERGSPSYLKEAWRRTKRGRDKKKPLLPQKRGLKRPGEKTITVN